MPTAGSPTGRRLDVLALLQAQPGISAGRIAARLGVTERTARRDVAHLRELGYRIDAEAGRAGGYVLASGTAVPPLLLDADEALAVAVGLRASAGVRGLEPAAATALAKLTATVPGRWRARFEAIAGADAPRRPSARDADPGALVALALACRAGEAVRIRRASGPRDVQPHRLVLLHGRWYAVVCERGDDRWRVHAVDRIADVQPLGTRLPTPPPPDDPTAFAVAALAHGGRRHVVRVRLFTSGDLARELVDPTVGEVRDEGDDRCVVTLGTDDLDWAARWLAYRNVDFEVLAPPELTDRLHALGRWLADAHARPRSGEE